MPSSQSFSIFLVECSAEFLSLRGPWFAVGVVPPNPRMLPPPIDERTLLRWQLLPADAWSLLLDGLSGYVAHPNVSGPQPVYRAVLQVAIQYLPLNVHNAALEWVRRHVPLTDYPEFVQFNPCELWTAHANANLNDTPHNAQYLLMLAKLEVFQSPPRLVPIAQLSGTMTHDRTRKLLAYSEDMKYSLHG